MRQQCISNKSSHVFEIRLQTAALADGGVEFECGQRRTLTLAHSYVIRYYSHGSSSEPARTFFRCPL